MMRSAHSTNETYIATLPHLAPQFVRSASVTPRAREQAPRAKTGISSHEDVKFLHWCWWLGMLGLARRNGYGTGQSAGG